MKIYLLVEDKFTPGFTNFVKICAYFYMILGGIHDLYNITWRGGEVAKFITIIQPKIFREWGGGWYTKTPQMYYIIQEEPLIAADMPKILRTK